LNPKIFVGIAVAAFAIIIGIIGFSGSVIIDDVTGRNVLSPSEIPNVILPLEVDLVDISILEVNEKAATVEVQFKVTNPNSKSVILQLINYELYENDLRIKISQIGERPIGMVDSSNYFTILPEIPTFLKDTVTIKNTGNTPELWDALSNNTPQWKIKGEASFNLSSITAGGENEISFEFHKNM
jgi:LEA14-like dessication related protein